MSTLVVPGVNVRAYFDVLPPQPAPSGIVGIVGVVDRIPANVKTIGITKISELRELIGPGSIYSLKPAVDALANGAKEVIVAPVSGGGAASLTLKNSEAVPKDVVCLKCRFNRDWGTKDLCASVRTILNFAGNPVRVTIEILVNGKTVETFPDLRIAPGEADDLFDAINRQSNLVVAMEPGIMDQLPKTALYDFEAGGADGKTHVDSIDVPGKDGALKLFQIKLIESENPGITVNVTSDTTTSIKIFKGSALQEEYTDLVMNPDSDNYLPFILLGQSKIIKIKGIAPVDPAKALPDKTAAPAAFAGGTSPTVDAYKTAIDLLSDDTRIDLVLAAVEANRSNDDIRNIHQALLSHAIVMSDCGAPRIAFGSITNSEAADKTLVSIKDHAATVRNRRFVLVSPPGAEGAVAGMIGQMEVQESPTFKTAPLYGMAPSRFRESELNKLLGPVFNLCVVQDRIGRGIIVLKGINTIGDQISVSRVADKAIRETKAISENYIGLLNTDDARVALKQQIFALFLRMEREGALVPSTDGKDPAFSVDVYSTQTDFAQGIVRIDIAVRPVRAIDYIYATIRVKN